MINHLSIIFISIHFYLPSKCSVVHIGRTDNNKEICVENQFQSVSTHYLKVCYFNDIQDRSILVWFTIEKSLNDTFDFYRFILRSMDNPLSTTVIIETLTNFTKLIDFNNSLRMFNLDSGYYEVCIEFQTNSSPFIYQLRDGCISIEVGKSSHESFTQSPTPLMIALASSIAGFFILGLVVQWGKGKRQKKLQDDVKKPQSPSSTIISSISLKEKHDRLIRNFFHRHLDQPRPSRMRQWARNRAFRHRISVQEQEFEIPKSLQKWNQYFSTSTHESSQPQFQIEIISDDEIPSGIPNLTTNNIYTISEKEHDQISSRKVSFHLSPSEADAMASKT